MNVPPHFFSCLVLLLSATTLLAANSLNDVSVSEYTKFLNAVAEEDQHMLYDQKMGEESGIASIERVGDPGSYSYYFHEEQAEEPMRYVDLRSAMRFCNWKENGEQEDPATTEHGVYELEEDHLLSVNIDEKTNCFLPSEQEEGCSSTEQACLRLRSLDDPASWLRSNQVLFHLKGRLENIATAPSREEKTSLLEDAGYVVGTIAAIATVATCYKYRDHCCPETFRSERTSEVQIKHITGNQVSSKESEINNSDKTRDNSNLHMQETLPPSSSLEKSGEVTTGTTGAEIDQELLNKAEDFLNFAPNIDLNEVEDILINPLSPNDQRELACRLLSHEAPFIRSLSDDLLRQELFHIALFIRQQSQDYYVLLKNPEIQQQVIHSWKQGPSPGLRNGGADCYLSSALQTLRTIVENLPPQERESKFKRLQLEYTSNWTEQDPDDSLTNELISFGSPLVAFLKKQFNGNNFLLAAFLRAEIQAIMERHAAVSESAPSETCKEMATNIDPFTGNSNHQHDASIALMALMEYLDMPRAFFLEKDIYLDSQKIRHSDHEEQLHGNELIIPLSITEPYSIQELITSSWSSNLSAVSDANSRIHDLQRKKILASTPDSLTFSLSRFLMKTDPKGGWMKNSSGEDIVGTPKLALNAQGTPISEKLTTPITDITQDILVPLATYNTNPHETTARYSPNAIICHNGGVSNNSGHYIAFVREGNSWHLIDDNFEYSEQADAEQADFACKDFIEKNAYIISYRHTAEISTSADSTSPITSAQER
ncbi:MAG: ubiquitin carboxyl-terminal hydrolase family protein [Verrucomicrobiae bacterium]|nr:ubiquitin carboxyl-terminal hydrolase family protein [Verrucomicrobiae bacterium]